MRDNTILCIGLDTCCFEQINPLFEDGELPNLTNLIDWGVSRYLTSTTPPWTSSAWPSITTGATPWKHGIYNFYDHTTDEPKLVSATDLQIPFLREYPDGDDLCSIIINVLVTHPIHTWATSLVPGYLASEATDVLIGGKPSAQTSLVEYYRIYPRKDDSRGAKISEIKALIESQVAAAVPLDASHDWSFMMVKFQRTDSVFPTMGHDQEAVRRVYRKVDETIERLLDPIDDDTIVLVVSDHGIQEYERTFRCTTWHRNEEWLQTSTNSTRYAWEETTKPTPEKELNEPLSIPRHLLSTSLPSLQHLGITPQRAEKALSLVGLSEPVRRQLRDEIILDVADHVDWSTSKTYCRFVSSLGIRCNVEGGDPDGIFSPAKFESIRSELFGTHEAIRAPDGTAVFKEVNDRHERHGSDVTNEAAAPDIVVRPNQMSWKITDVIHELVFDTIDEFSNTYEGLFIAVGQAIDPDVDISPKRIDIAPTILELFGYRPTPTKEGTTLSELHHINNHALSDAIEPGSDIYLSEEIRALRDSNRSTGTTGVS